MYPTRSLKDASLTLQHLCPDMVHVSLTLGRTKVGSHSQQRSVALVQSHYTHEHTFYAPQIQNSTFYVRRGGSELDFLKTWKPVVRHPSEDVAKLNLLGYQEL